MQRLPTIVTRSLDPRCALMLSFALSLSACVGGGTATLPEPGPNRDTTLGAGDVFDVRVYGEEDLSDRYQVGQDGSIDFPFIGRIEVEGLEPTAAAQRIAEGLREGGYLRSPHVSVVVEEYNSKRITVMGAVNQTGNYPMTSGLTVVQAISLAGGFTPLANRGATMVTRRVDDEIRRYQVDVDEVTRGRSDDFELRAGDIVYVPERPF